MYIRKIELENIKSFKKYTWSLDQGEQSPGWHVLLGKNGSGKSTFIRSAAVALIGGTESIRTRATFSDWISKGKDKAFIRVEISHDSSVDSWAKVGRNTKDDFTISMRIDETGVPTKTSGSSNYPERTVWGGKKGWFSASYGPFRRFSGGGSEYQKLFYSSPLLARHLSVFGEDVALTETLEWLKLLRFKELEDSRSNTVSLLSQIKAFLNQDDLLPGGVRMEEVSSSGVLFKDAFGTNVDIIELSDGYRSVLSLMLELIRQLANCYGDESIFSSDYKVIDCPGVVFIDEIDVHLHPSWQRKIGEWLTRHFPKIQFIVSTHSALICQSALNGTISILPSADGTQKGQKFSGYLKDRLVFGNILEALSSGAFGLGVERSEKASELLDELAELNIAFMEDELSSEETKRREYLMSVFPLEFGSARGV
ncbi:AAA family ATPase [Aeromonas veronii]|uniref:AAA family ATPase n=1 Tax=Aeromonas veronii TaxID=654 RepID=UPI004055575D